jgi:hypothetical protein
VLEGQTVSKLASLSVFSILVDSLICVRGKRTVVRVCDCELLLDSATLLARGEVSEDNL